MVHQVKIYKSYFHYTLINYGARLENFEVFWMRNTLPRQPGQELGSSAVPGHYS